MIHPGYAVVWHNVEDTIQMVHSGKGQMILDDGDAVAMDSDAMKAPMTSHSDATDHHGHGSSTTPRGPVEDLSGALQVDLTHVPTGTTRTLTLEAAFDDPGHYIAPIIPTAPGAYRFHLTGEIRGTKVDQSFDSGPGTFDDIQTQTSIQFPLEVSAPREIEGAVRAAEDAAAVSEELASAASADASSAQTLAIGALVVGIIGLVFGIGGMAVGFRKN